MGKTGSSPAHEPGGIVHPRLGPVVFREEEDDMFVMEMLLHLDSYKQYEDWTKAKAVTNEAIVVPLRHQLQPRPICVSAGEVLLCFESLPFVLEKELADRRTKGIFYEESNAWYLLLVMLEACVDDDIEKNKKFFDIRPKNVLLSPSGETKILTGYSLPGFANGITATAEDNEKAYLAPEELKALREGKYSPQEMDSLCETFSIGLTMLEVCTLQSPEKLYLQGRQFDHKELASMLDRLQRTNYSAMLKRLVALMLEPEQDQRMSTGQIWSMFLPYENQIFAMEPFNFNSSVSSQAVQKYYEKLIAKQTMPRYIENAGVRKQFMSQNPPRASSIRPFEYRPKSLLTPIAALPIEQRRESVR